MRHPPYGFWVFFYDFLDFVCLSSVKKIRRRISFDPYPPDIVEYRNLRPPYPPKKVRRLLWTAPYCCTIVRRKESRSPLNSNIVHKLNIKDMKMKQEMKNRALIKSKSTTP